MAHLFTIGQGSDSQALSGYNSNCETEIAPELSWTKHPVVMAVCKPQHLNLANWMEQNENKQINK